MTIPKPTILHVRPSARSIGLLICSAVLVLFAMAASLTPAPSGFGTHRQLGLPPCTTLAVFGIRCPMCGMTTAWSHTIRGDLVAAANSNLGGLLLAGYAVYALAMSRRMIVHNHWPSRGNRNAATFSLLAITCVTVVNWCWRLG